MAGQRPSTRLFASGPPSLESLKQACARTATAEEYPLAASISSNIPVYELQPYRSLSSADREELQDEWYRVLADGPGVLVLSGMYPGSQSGMLDGVSDVFRRLVDEERRSQRGSGDHFAAAGTEGTNDRLWNSFSKHALADPESFVRYYANPYLALVCEAWLGPGYRVTAQMNNVKPGGPAQECHRDYHLGFQTGERAGRFPRSAHVASQTLTLQGAVAHVDVPAESGPTRVLPFSQTFEEGYMAYRLGEFRDHFVRSYASLPMRKGDGLFFNPALFHAAGANVSAGVNRMVNLLQVSSGMGRPMETIETVPVVDSCWDHLARMCEDRGGDVDDDEVAAVVAAVGDGYPFPTNLDRNAPGPSEMVPPSEQTVLLECLRERRGREETVAALRALAERSRA